VNYYYQFNEKDEVMEYDDYVGCELCNPESFRDESKTFVTENFYFESNTATRVPLEMYDEDYYGYPSRTEHILPEQESIFYPGPTYVSGLESPFRDEEEVVLYKEEMEIDEDARGCDDIALATIYVKPQVYRGVSSAATALKHGTAFKELYRPFVEKCGRFN